MTRSVLSENHSVNYRCFEQESRVLDLMPFPVFALRENGEIAFANQSARELLSVSSIEGAVLDYLAFEKPDGGRVTSIGEVEALAENPLVISMWRLSDGEVFEVELILRSMKFSDCDKLNLLTINNVSHFKTRERELSRMANSDELTGLANRRSFLHSFHHEVERAKRYQKDLSVVLLDIDHFKKVNDQFGHPVGDEVLRHFAQEAKKVLREVDVLGRVGGEEFAILMPETDLHSARRVAERLRKHIANAGLRIDSGVLNYTFSAGVVTAKAGHAEVDGMMRHADVALYDAKHAGRNRVEASVYPYMQQQHLPLVQKAAC